MPVHKKIIFPRFAERFHGKVDSFSEPGTGGLLEFVFQIIHIPVGIAEPLCFAKSVLAAIGVSSEGYREILGVAEGSREDKESWDNFLRYLKERGLKGVKLVISDKAAELADALGNFFPEAQWQRCVVYWYRNSFNKYPYKYVKTVAAMLKAIHAQEDEEAAREKAVLAPQNCGR